MILNSHLSVWTQRTADLHCSSYKVQHYWLFCWSRKRHPLYKANQCCISAFPSHHFMFLAQIGSEQWYKINITKPSHNIWVLEARFIHPLGLCRVETEGWRGKLCSCVGVFLTQVLTDLKQRIPERAELFLFVMIVARVENIKRDSAPFNKSKLKI